jgi:hypothetical protein
MAIPTVFPDRLPALTTLRLADGWLGSELLWMWLRKVDGDRFLEVLSS